MHTHIASDLRKIIEEGLRQKRFLTFAGLSQREAAQLVPAQKLDEIATAIAATTEADGRFDILPVTDLLKETVEALNNEPPCGWLRYCYYYILAQIYPENVAYWTDDHIEEVLKDDHIYKTGRALVLQILRSLFRYEKLYLPFAPTREMHFLSAEEIIRNDFNREYLRLREISTDLYIYEFMRIGCTITPFDTLGHVCGVHYVSTFTARQLYRAGVPVDIGLVSGAAATHDIGKYGSKKSEERRVPYLHYFYTDLCCRRMGIPAIGHIAANHSVWDLELENLSVEALLLIYADFRVKSERVDGKEIVRFYTLAQAFNVILDKLDNVDEKKKHRYQKVYAKLADFESYMKEMGVETDLPADFADEPAVRTKKKRPEAVLLEGEEVVDALKYAAIDHNIELMNIFQKENKFSRLVEAARSERSWKNVRNYIGTFEEYSTYMTEQQKLMTLQYLYEVLTYKDVDIRMQAARLMGVIVAKFTEHYSKELPEGVTLPGKKVTGVSLFAHYLSIIIKPGWRFTYQHRLWISYCLGPFVQAALQNCDDGERTAYIAFLQTYYERTNYQSEICIVLLTALMEIEAVHVEPSFLERARTFTAAALHSDDRHVCVAALRCKEHLFDDYAEERYFADLLDLLELPHDEEAFAEREGLLFLDNLKMGTHWVVKEANIEILLHYLQALPDRSSVMHLGTHLTNVLKMSENPFVQRAAGAALLRVSHYMTYTQRNEIAVELFNGLELGDLRISQYVPEYLGRIILQLEPRELDECINTLETQILAASTQVASSMIHTVGVMLGNFREFSERFPEDEGNNLRKRRLLYVMIKAYAHYDKELSRDAFRHMGRFIFANPDLTLAEVDFLFIHSYKKILILLAEEREEPLDFYSNAAVLNHIYRYIGIHQFITGPFPFEKKRKVCFYPGTFDPFSLGHKAVAVRIRDLGFDVYLALDEFSWSKHTQPRLMRRKIMNMSTADKEHIYPFPDDIPINMANPADLKRLKAIFADRELYIAVGTDVIKNASAYKNEPTEHSIHTINHIAFERETRENHYLNSDAPYPIQGEVVPLLLDKFYEDISSTRIRENIDLNRDISNLIDAVAQSFIYKNNLYLREPAYKHVFEAKDMSVGTYKARGHESLWPIQEKLVTLGYKTENVEEYIEKGNVRTLYIDSADKNKEIIAYAAAHHVGTRDLHGEFGDAAVVSHIRTVSEGSVASIGFIYADTSSAIANIWEIIITELMSELIARDYAYAVYHPVDKGGYDEAVLRALQDQGFRDIAPDRAGAPVYAASLKAPVVLFRDVETVLKNPFNKNECISDALDKAHKRLLSAMRHIYPGKLILSFNTSVVHNKIIKKAVQLNGVSITRDEQRRYGPYMSVPFGKTLSDVLVPNTVTKALHIEKYFNRSVEGFTMAESCHYSSVDNQVRTIKSFNRPVILIDDLLHKGYRMQMLAPHLEKNGIDVRAVLTGVMTGRAMDMMTEKRIKTESAYFLPTLEVWLNERDCYPFLGGDSIVSVTDYDGQDSNPFINLVLPYVKPGFVGGGDDDAAYTYSMICLQNARDIMEALQQEYQRIFEKRLTLKRLGEVVTPLRIPDMDVGVIFDENMNPSRFIENDIERLIRLRWKRKQSQKRSGKEAE